ncbi:MAG: IS66 family insertion sequence element accessory protein TnpB [Bdellovibrio sp.]|nr:IS66 family insertion sequence element accessory protein TnpB [Bdellovibrio sp.]
MDMRKSISGLSMIVASEMKLDLKANSLFIFTNKPRTHIKILYFDRSGFALWLKRIGSLKATFDHSMKYEFISRGLISPVLV